MQTRMTQFDHQFYQWPFLYFEYFLSNKIFFSSFFNKFTFCVVVLFYSRVMTHTLSLFYRPRLPLAPRQPFDTYTSSLFSFFFQRSNHAADEEAAVAPTAATASNVLAAFALPWPLNVCTSSSGDDSMNQRHSFFMAATSDEPTSATPPDQSLRRQLQHLHKQSQGRFEMKL